MRKTVAVGVAVVVAVLAVVAADAVGSPVAWAAAAILVVVTAALVATVPLTPALQRVLVVLGAVLGVVAIVVAVAEFAVRGFRTGSTADLLGLAAGLGGLLVVAGVAAARSAPSPTALWGGAAALAALGLVAGLVVAATVPFLPLSRAVDYTTADAVTQVQLATPDNVEDGDVLVAQVYRVGAGDVSPPPGWTTLRTTALPNGAGTVSLFTTTAEEAGAPITFTSTGGPATMLAGVRGWSNVDAATSTGETTGTAGPVDAAPAPADPGTQVLYFVAGAGFTDIVPPAPLGNAWTLRTNQAVEATAALVGRPPLDQDPAAPVSLTTSAPLGAWAVQTVVLTAR